MKPVKPKCNICGADYHGGIACEDVFICDACRGKHADKTDDELLAPFLFDEDGHWIRKTFN
jgi:hypothetical protein